MIDQPDTPDRGHNPEHKPDDVRLAGFDAEHEQRVRKTSAEISSLLSNKLSALGLSFAHQETGLPDDIKPCYVASLDGETRLYGVIHTLKDMVAVCDGLSLIDRASALTVRDQTLYLNEAAGDALASLHASTIAEIAHAHDYPGARR